MEMDALDMEMDSLHTKADALRVDIQSLRVDIQSLRVDIQSMREDNQSMREDIEELKQHARVKAQRDLKRYYVHVPLELLTLLDQLRVRNLLDEVLNELREKATLLN